MIDVAKELRKIRDVSGLSQQKIADLIGIPQRTWSGYESGKSQPPMKVLFSLAEKGYTIPGLTANIMSNLLGQETLNDILEFGKTRSPDMSWNDLARDYVASKQVKGLNKLPIYVPSDLPEGSFVVPLLNQQLSAGPGAALPEADEAKALIRVPGYLSQYGENIAALEVDGDSMEPTLHRGDMVVCDSCGWSGEGIYAVRMGGSGFVKRLTKAPGKVVVLSDNPKYPPREESEGSEDFSIVGRVHCAITKVE
ncbi:MAG: LexA family transcriptional regulator [Treponema sp.]|jgi:SOS-response transcriptional repressor LexA/DNA-binding XRE family transcriptional regulator|nr:LexA family transcriptional regulator [Treponema sp.]